MTNNQLHTTSTAAAPERDAYFTSPSTGRTYWIDERGVAIPELPYGDDYQEGPTCSLCDALGHGYPGAGPCPLEQRGYDDAREDEAREAAMGVLPWGVLS